MSSKALFRCVPGAFLLIALALTSSRGSTYVFPSDANIVNVKDFGATGNDNTDDTKAIRNAIKWAFGNSDRYAAFPFIYFPNGTYYVSGPIQNRVEAGTAFDGWRSCIIMVGQNRTSTVIRLKNGAPDYDDPSSPKPVIMYGSEWDSQNNAEGGGNQAFRNSIKNMTIHTGNNNPGAIGIDYLSNNGGVVEEVTVISGDGSGVAGIDLSKWWPGPALIKDVEIQGFDYGIRSLIHNQHSMTFENITLKNQKLAGIVNEKNMLTFRNIVSVNSVPVFRSTWYLSGQVVIIGGDFSGGGSTDTALINKSYLLAKDITSRGYGTVIGSWVTGNSSIHASGAETTVEEWVSQPAVTLHGASGVTLDLPVEETPTYNTTNLNQWESVLTHGAKPNDNSFNSRPAIQAAIDAGKEIVYFPSGKYFVAKTVVVRGDVKKLIGLRALIAPVTGRTVEPLVRFDGGTQSEVILEEFRINGIVEHNSSKTLVIKNTKIQSYRNTSAGRGKLFMEDVVGHPLDPNSPRYAIKYPQKVWGRQVNAEFGNVPIFENNGGTLWLLGYKTEGNATVLKTVGGKTELYGGFFLVNERAADNTPAILNDESETSHSFTITRTNYPLKIRDRQNGVWKEWSEKNDVILYASHDRVVKTTSEPRRTSSGLVTDHQISFDSSTMSLRFPRGMRWFTLVSPSGKILHCGVIDRTGHAKLSRGQIPPGVHIVRSTRNGESFQAKIVIGK